MPKKLPQLLVGLLISILIIVGCGITEELDQAKNAIQELQVVLKNQKDNYKTFDTLSSQITKDFNADLEKMPETGMFQSEEGQLYKNHQKRTELLNTMDKNNHTIEKLQKELQKIEKAKGADVPQEQLKTITHSTEIIIKNYDAFEILATSGLNQEKELYEQLPVKDLDTQNYLIHQTYGSAHTISEESIVNIDYTLKQSKNFRSILSKQAKEQRKEQEKQIK